MKITSTTAVLLAPVITCHGLTVALRQQILDQHNSLRGTFQAANMLQMEYDVLLEEVAQNYMNKLGSTFVHNPERSEDYQALGGSGYVGENWFSGLPENATYEWVDGTNFGPSFNNGCSEKEAYIAHYLASDTQFSSAVNIPKCGPSGNPSPVVGHFSQVMWPSTTKVGCGYVTPSATHVGGTLCDYSPGGNVNGFNLVTDGGLEFGEACSQCNQTAYPYCVEGECATVNSEAVVNSKAGSATAGPLLALCAAALAQGL